MVCSVILFTHTPSESFQSLSLNSAGEMDWKAVLLCVQCCIYPLVLVFWDRLEWKYQPRLKYLNDTANKALTHSVKYLRVSKTERHNLL